MLKKPQITTDFFCLGALVVNSALCPLCFFSTFSVVK